MVLNQKKINKNHPQSTLIFNPKLCAFDLSSFQN